MKAGGINTDARSELKGSSMKRPESLPKPSGGTFQEDAAIAMIGIWDHYVCRA